MTQKQVALALKLPVNHISDIVHGRRRITADTALRLARYFEMSAHFWLGLQTDYDLDVAEDAIGEKLDQEVAVLTQTKNFQRLTKSIAQLEAGKGVERALIE